MVGFMGRQLGGYWLSADTAQLRWQFRKAVGTGSGLVAT
jgi:hypothetical protein